MNYGPADIWKIMEEEKLRSVVFYGGGGDMDPYGFTVMLYPGKDSDREKEERLLDYMDAISPTRKKLQDMAVLRKSDDISVDLDFCLAGRKVFLEIFGPKEEDVDITEDVDLSIDMSYPGSVDLYGITAGDLLSALEANRISTVEAEFSGGGDEGRIEAISFLKEGREVKVDRYLSTLSMRLLELYLEDEYGSFGGNFWVSGSVVLDVAERKVDITGDYRDYDDRVEIHRLDVSDIFAEGKTQ